MRLTLLAALAVLAAVPAFADDDDKPGNKSKMKFWNLTGEELVEVTLAPAGTDKFGENQTKNDDNDAIEADERLPLTGITAGRYDVRVKDRSGRICLITGVDVRDTGPYSFSLEHDELKDCSGGAK